MARAFKHDIQHPIRLAICVKRFRQPVADWSPTSRRSILPDCKHVAVTTATSRRSVADQLQTCRRLVGDYNLLSIYGHKVVGQVSSIASQLQRNQSRTGREQVAESVKAGLYLTAPAKVSVKVTN